MYNLTVDDAHTFFVGEQAWLVHNTCDLDFWFDRRTESIEVFTNDSTSSLNPTISSNMMTQILALKNTEGKLIQISIYDANGNVIYHIDAPDGKLGWHYHSFIAEPGNPEIGHGHGKPHYLFSDVEEVIALLRSRGLQDDELRTLGLIP
jgi:hypothetical protein